MDETKAALAAAGLPTDFVPIPFTPNLVKTGGQVVLIDTGTGGQTGGPKAGVFMKNLAAAGVDPASVNHIVISHFHPDHIFGLMTKAPENKVVFPNAVDPCAVGRVRLLDGSLPESRSYPKRAVLSPGASRRCSR